MKPESRPIIDLLVARTRQLRLLANDLLESRQALVRLDLDAIHRHNAQQEMYCEEVRHLDSQILGVSGSPVAGRTLSLDGVVNGWDDEAQEQLRSILEDHEAARCEVQELSQVQADLLQRSRRYLRILSNLVSNSTGLYEAPRFEPVRAGVGRGN
jgi:uncharacterized protein YhaN